MCERVQIGKTVAIVCVGGPDKKIRVCGQVWHFEMHRYCGPMPLNKRTGAVREGSRAFWKAVTHWAQQGERVDADGICVYDADLGTDTSRNG